MSQDPSPLLSRRELRQARAAASGEPNFDGVPPEPVLTERGVRDGSAPVYPTSAPPAPVPTGPQASTEAEGADTPVRAAAPRARRAADAPVDSPVIVERSSQVRARNRAELRATKERTARDTVADDANPPTRRQLRLRQLQEQGGAAGAAVAPEGKGNNEGKVSAQPTPTPRPSTPGPTPPGELSVEQALAARAQIADDAQKQVEALAGKQDADPTAVDPEILAQQVALAERAAVLNRRAQAKQKLSGKPLPPRPTQDPSAVSNLAMVTPLEFEQVPGIDRPVMKRPATSHVPVVTTPGPRIKPVTGRSRVIARAEAAARAAGVTPESRLGATSTSAVEPDPQGVDSAAGPQGSASDSADLPPVAARSAYGLDPLDVVTAGLGRARRMRVLQFTVLGVGGLAILLGIIFMTGA
ncbi:hypothetical protein [Pseudarthrobacter sp. PS3-L1]|uniref:hypothetical protein n=1 Tax=Pseudarthrobacter sp. PS3-L1 TaxID=3046207 RepID=UPI0024B88C55|nr:hypothetical protein [Pseudarthrobacter sp. PS3-L1]MDJ0319860.1 hypothetical protein [Pseudarthrobacter sp. PS3-L1]